MTTFLEHLQYPFFQRTLLACLLVGGACGLFSTFVVLRRLVFASVALTQLSSAGLGIAALTGLGALPTSLATTILGVGVLGMVRSNGKSRTDNFIALLYIGGWAASVLLFAIAERGDTEIAAILYGDILGVLARDIYAFIPVALIVAAVVIGLSKELLFVSFDPETAATYRIPVWLYDTLLFATLGIVIVFAVKMLGLLLVFAFLVAPGTAALLFCRRLPSATVFAVAFACVMAVVGLACAAGLDLPPGPAVTFAGLVLLGLLWCVRAAQRAVASGREGLPSRSTAPTMLRSAAVVLALMLIAVGLGAFAAHIGIGAHDHSADHNAQPVGQDATSAADAPGTGDAADQATDYADSMGDELPNVEELLNP